MSRIRTLKPEWLDDEVMASLDDGTRVLSVALILMADDHGNGRAAPNFIAGRVWSYSSDSMDTVSRKTREGLANLSRAKFVSLYEVKGQQYYSIINWHKHQRVDKPSSPRVPGPELATSSRDPLETLAPDPDPIPRSHTPLSSNSASSTDGRVKGLSAQYRAHEPIVSRVLAALSKRTGTAYRLVDGHAKVIVARLKDGATEKDLRMVIWDRANRWIGTEQEQYLRPSTLFRPGHWHEYLDQARAAWRKDHGDSEPELTLVEQ